MHQAGVKSWETKKKNGYVHKATTSGRICFTNGDSNKMVKPQDVESFLEDNPDYYKGKTVKNKHIPWNKGLTKYDDERLMENSINRKELLKERPVGFCGRPGCHFNEGETVSEYEFRNLNQMNSEKLLNEDNSEPSLGNKEGATTIESILDEKDIKE